MADGLSVERSNILGVGVSAINMPIALDTIGGWIAARERHYVCITGVHGVMESQRDPELRRIHNAAGLVTPDGMPLVWLAALARHPRRRPGLRARPDAGPVRAGSSSPRLAPFLLRRRRRRRRAPAGEAADAGFPGWT